MANENLDSLGLGQPLTGDTYIPHNNVEPDSEERHEDIQTPKLPTSTENAAAPPALVSNDTVSPHRPHASSEATALQEIPTTNPAVHVVITNAPRPRAQTDAMSVSKTPSSSAEAAANRHRADTTASMASTMSSRSFATSTTSTSDMADEDDDDADDYDPATGGDEKSCIKEKRVKEWKKRFHPGDGEELLCTHGCALVIEIMIHGRMYLSNKRICFRSNILGVRTKREIPLKHVHAIVLKNVAGMIPNSFEVHHNDKKSQFTTLPDRDHTLRILIRNWKQENPQVFSVFIEKHPEFSQYLTGSDGPPAVAAPGSTGIVAPPPVPTAEGGEKGAQPSEQIDALKDESGTSGGPRAATKADTQDLEKVALDTILPSEPEKIYKLLYHNDEFLQGIWKEQGFKDIQMQPWINGQRDFQYARPVGSIGSTTCKSSERIVQPEGQDDWYCVEGTTQTPGVPSGKSFCTRSKTVFTWAEGGGTKMRVTFQVDWTGKSMLKGTINSQSVSGQKQWNSLLAKKIREHIKLHPEEFPPTKGAKAGAGEEDAAGDVGAGVEASKSGLNNSTSASEEPRDPLESLESQKTLLLESGPIAYLMDDPIRGALLVLFTLMLLSSLLGAAKRLLWTGKVVSVPASRLHGLEAAEAELRVLVGDVRGHLKRAAGSTLAAAGRGRGVVDAGTTGVVGGTGKVVRRTVVP